MLTIADDPRAKNGEKVIESISFSIIPKAKITAAGKIQKIHFSLDLIRPTITERIIAAAVKI